MKRLSRIAAATLILVFAGVVIWQQRANSKLRDDLASSRDQLAEARRLLDDEKTLAAQQNDDNEARRRERSELARLRDEVSRLKQPVKSAPVISEKQALETIATPRPLTRDQIKSFSTNLVAELNSGETIVTGGWETRQGTKTFAMITPEFVDPAGNVLAIPAHDSQLTMQAQFVEFAKEFLDANLVSQLGSGVLTREAMAALLENLQSKAGTSVLATPKMTTSVNMQGELSIMQSIDVEGESIHLGPVVNFRPSISPNGTGLTVELQTSINIGPQPPSEF